MNKNQKIVGSTLLALPALFYLHVAIQLLILNVPLFSLLVFFIVLLLVITSISLYKHSRPLLFVAVIVLGLGILDGIESLVNILADDRKFSLFHVVLSMFYVYPIILVVKLLRRKDIASK